jgi:2-keto-4-pentenoate hydratase/2-oxohepta-3-ene-1,7-dioic acid hydratase in catechol pathway
MGNHLAFVPSGTPVKGPTYSKALDYELELGFVLSRPLFNASPEEAIAAIGAFVVLNDFSDVINNVLKWPAGLVLKSPSIFKFNF